MKKIKQFTKFLKKLTSNKDKKFWITLTLWAITFILLIVFVAVLSALHDSKTSGSALTVAIIGLLFITFLLSGLFYIVFLKHSEKKNKGGK